MQKFNMKLLIMVILAIMLILLGFISLSLTQVKSKSWRNLGEFRITYYCPGTCCNGSYAWKPTASGTRLTPGRSIAVDPRIIPLGSRVKIGKHVYIAEDTGGAIYGNRIDVCVSSHAKAERLGIKYKKVKIYR